MKLHAVFITTTASVNAVSTQESIGVLLCNRHNTEKFHHWEGLCCILHSVFSSMFVWNETEAYWISDDIKPLLKIADTKLKQRQRECVS